MTIKLPTSFTGPDGRVIDGKEAYDEIMSRPDVQVPEKNSTNQASSPNLEGFIYIPSIKLYVAKERTHLGKDWFESHKSLISEGLRMPTIPEFIEFLKYTKTNFPEIYKEITEVRSSWKAEWLDADFKVVNEKLHINCYHVLDSNGNLIPKNSELLDNNTLMENKTPGISLEDYLTKNHTNQGLPSKNVNSGDFYYRYPISDNNSVARFYVYSVWTLLDCNGYASGRGSPLGVRAVFSEIK